MSDVNLGLKLTPDIFLLMVKMQAQDAMAFLQTGQYVCLNGIVDYDCLTCSNLNCNFSKLVQPFINNPIKALDDKMKHWEDIK